MQEINLYDLIKHYARYWLFIFVMTLLGLIGGLIYNHYQVPLYKSTSTLILIDPKNSTSSTAANTTLINNYLALMKSRRVLEPVISNLNLNISYEQLVSDVTTSNDKDTQVVKLTISSTNPQTSKQAVDGTVASFKDEVKRLYDVDSIKIVDGANTPTAPYNVRKNIQLGLAAAAGFLLSLIIVFFIYDFNLNRKQQPETATEEPPKETKPKAPKKTGPRWYNIIGRLKARTAAAKQAQKDAEWKARVEQTRRNRMRAASRKAAAAKKKAATTKTKSKK